MLSLLSILRRFGHIIRLGWKDTEFRGLTIIIAIWVAVGTAVYSVQEDWTVVEGFYFSVMTLTTIGYGDLAPTTTLTRLYTVPYAVMGIGLFVAFNTRLVQIAIDSRRRLPPSSQIEHPT